MSTYKPWVIWHLHLEEPLPELPVQPAVDGCFVVFWMHGLPLGHKEILATQLPVPAGHMAAMAANLITNAVGAHLFEEGFHATLPVVRQFITRTSPPDFQRLRNMQHPLSRLAERLKPVVAKTPAESISVIVCTRDRPEPLAQCLEALLHLDPPPHEIVVVDNASRSDATRHLVESMPGIRYVREPRPGLSVARNTGIRHSTGDLIAFTDDDVLVQPNWLAGVRRGFLEPAVQAVTGLILPTSLQTEAQFIFQAGQGRFGWGYRPLRFGVGFFELMKGRGVPVWHIGAGANMAFRRSIFDRLGGFDERLGAGASGCSEDSEMWYRILAVGGTCQYEPTAVVHHYHRDDLEGLNHQMYQYMRGHLTALLVQFEKYRHAGNLYRAFGILPVYYLRLLLRALRRGFRSESRTLGAQVRGCVAGVVYYLRHRHGAANPDVHAYQKKRSESMANLYDHV